MQVQKQPLFVPVMVRDVSPLLAGAIEPRRCLVDSVVAVADRVLVEVCRFAYLWFLFGCLLLAIVRQVDSLRFHLQRFLVCPVLALGYFRLCLLLWCCCRPVVVMLLLE